MPTAHTQRLATPKPSRHPSGSMSPSAYSTVPPVSVMTAQPTLPLWVVGLLAHLREHHDQPLDLLGDPRRHGGLVRLVHAAMHNDRHHPGHFHHRGQVLHLWEQTDHIQQVDTHHRT
jgi:hypothetical protein